MHVLGAAFDPPSLKDPSSIIAFLPPKPRRRPILVPSSNLPAVERIRLLMSGGLQEKKVTLFEGDPQPAAAEALAWLAKHASQ
ncbi:MAG: hypothetical protein JW990_12945 [Thermoleophilia bacterium]|nr:hypothetical protein [Thermoleophilia bacterium]